MKAILKPTFLNTFFQLPVINAVRSVITGNYQQYRLQDALAKDIEKNLIRNNNLQSLKEQMQKAGFTFQMDTTLQNMLRHDFDSFHIRYNDPLHCKNTDYILHFKKIPDSDIYYFDKFAAAATPDLKSVLNHDHATVKQTFSMQSDLLFSAQEAAVLVNKGHICKNIDGREKWVALDLTKINSIGKPYLRNSTFDLRRALSKLPFIPSQMENPAFIEKLIETLKTGASRVVDLMVEGGKAMKYKIHAAPHLNKIVVHDTNNKMVDVARLIKGAAMTLSSEVTKVVNMSNIETDEFTPGLQKGKRL
ncbi:hypothetical protein [Chitinophaga sp. 22321]|uniref:hypothetical protein n=1 Tax=Chitinophaga sp. 22321 TaxID=3453909 RepID=UPI003F84E82E